MKRKIIAIIMMAVLIFNLSACGTTEKNKIRYSAEFLELFNTVTMIVGYADSKDEFAEYSQLIYDNLKEYHELYDIYNDYDGINNIKTINDNAGISPVKVDQRIIDMLKFSKESNDLTKGKVNVALGAVLKVWHDYRTEGIENPEAAKLPPWEVLEEKAKHTDINKVIIDEEASTVYLEDPEMRLDVGAIAKGYATERVSEITIEQGYTNGLLSVGGNVRAIGGKEEKNEVMAWSVGIQNPDTESEDAYIDVLGLKDLSLVSSGDYERYYTVDGIEYNHIIDPDTLMPGEYMSAISIVCEDSGRADALSTAVFLMPYEEGLALIESLQGTEAMWVLDNGEIKYSSGFEEYSQ